jgi:biotin carboxylase
MENAAIVYIDTMGLGMGETIARAARERGLSTILVAPRPPSRVKDSSIARNIYTNDFSLEGLRKILRTVDRSFEIRGLYSCFGSFRVEGFLHGNVAALAAERGLVYPSPDALAAATNKFLTRYRLASAGVPDVPFGLAQDEDSLLAIAQDIGYPVILKPVTGVGSSLIYKCNNNAQALASWREALKQIRYAHYEQLRMAPHTVRVDQYLALFFDPMRSMLVERYLPGREISVECIVTGSRVIPLVVHDKLTVEERSSTVLEHLLIAPPTRFTPSEVRKIRHHAVIAIGALGLRNTFCHVELRWVEGEGPRVLEINPRIGAGCVTDSIETFTDLRVDSARISLILGKTVRYPRIRKAPCHAMVFIFAPKSGLIKKLSGLREINQIPFVRVVRVMCGVGDTVGGDNEEGFIAGIWMEVKNEKDAQRARRRVRSLVKAVID